MPRPNFRILMPDQALVVLLAWLLAIVSAGPAAADEPERITVDDLEVVAHEALSERLHEYTFRTPALTHDTSVRVLLPEGYDPSGATRYPTLFLLHGGGGSYRDWTEAGDAAAATAGLPLIVVMPDNLKHGNYVDWYNAGKGGPPMWETYIIGQLLPWVDATLPTIGQRHGRAVAGLSMGGGGAMGYATRHPDLFVAAAAFSGAVDTNTLPVQLLAQTSGMEDGAALAGVYGLRATQEIRWRGHNPWDLADNLRSTYVELHTGNGLPGGPGGDLGDPVELAVWQMMTNLHDRLDQLSIAHLWNDYGPGGHTWFYWQRDLRLLVPRLMDVFAERRPAPQSFSFKAIEPRYDVWGWDVAIERPALEFSHLVDASPDGFALRGSGEAQVRTAPYYEPGQRVLAEVADSTGQRTVELTADASGRVDLAVTLGPGNPHQQLTTQATIWMLTNGHTTWPVHAATVRLRPQPAGEQHPSVSGTTTAPTETSASVPSRTGGERLPATGAAVPMALVAVMALLGIVVRRLT